MRRCGRPGWRCIKHAKPLRNRPLQPPRLRSVQIAHAVNGRFDNLL